MLNYREIRNYPVHIKLDTGMHRLGFQEDDIIKLLPLLANGPFRVASVFSHLAASDEPRHDDFSREQFHRFEGMSSLLSETLGYTFDRHILNSAGIERFPDAQYEMVRLGIGLHGIGADPATGSREFLQELRFPDKARCQG